MKHTADGYGLRSDESLLARVDILANPSCASSCAECYMLSKQPSLGYVLRLRTSEHARSWAASEYVWMR